MLCAMCMSYVCCCTVWCNNWRMRYKARFGSDREKQCRLMEKKMNNNKYVLLVFDFEQQSHTDTDIYFKYMVMAIYTNDVMFRRLCCVSGAVWPWLLSACTRNTRATIERHKRNKWSFGFRIIWHPNASPLWISPTACHHHWIDGRSNEKYAHTIRWLYHMQCNGCAHVSCAMFRCMPIAQTQYVCILEIWMVGGGVGRCRRPM